MEPSSAESTSGRSVFACSSQCFAGRVIDTEAPTLTMSAPRRGSNVCRQTESRAPRAPGRFWDSREVRAVSRGLMGIGW
jgi:hypothetical protein